MRLDWIEDLLAVAETGSFQAAAKRRRLTQSAFSRRIRHIEQQIGVDLFDRSRKPVRLRALTPELREQMERAASGLRQLGHDLRRGEQPAANRITLASQHALTTALTPRLARAVHARHEAAHVRLRSANLDECLALLLTRQADIAIVYRLPGEEHPVGQGFVETAVIGTDRLIPVFDAAGVPALLARLDAGDLPYIAFPPQVFLGRVLDRHILPRAAGLARPLVMAETALTLAALELAAVGVAVAFVPLSLAARRIGQGALADLSERLPSHPLEITALRRIGTPGPVAASLWAEIATPAEGS